MWCPPQGHLQPHPCELGEVLAPLSQLLPPSHPHGSGCSLCQLRGGGVTAKAPRGTGVVPPPVPRFKNSSSFPPFQSPVSQKQRGSVQRCCAPCCSPSDGVGSRDVLLPPKTSSAPELCPCSVPASSGALGDFAAQFGSGDQNPIFWFHCCLPGPGAELGTVWGSQCTQFGVCWFQCSVPPSGLLMPSASRLLLLGRRNRGTFRSCGAVSQGWAFLQILPSSSLPAVDRTSSSEQR